MTHSDGRAQASFLCVCSEKCVKVSTDDKLERAFQSLALKRHLESLGTRLPNPPSVQFMYLPGAGIVYDSERCTCSVDGCLLAVFTGALENYAYLVKKYCLSATQLDPSRPWRLETIRDLSPLTDAQVVATLYSELGATFMSKLKGSFAFCIYDARSGRVLVANDASASFNVWQGHLAEDHSLIVGCGLEAPTKLLESGQSTPIRAGEYKFGWRSTPISYASSKASITLKASDAMSAAMAALSACAPSQSSSTDMSPAQPVPAVRAASAHKQAKAALAYVPPHKRASPASAAWSWRCSSESAQTGRTPPSAHHFVNRNAISMDQPRSHRSSAGASAARVDVLEALEDSSVDNLLEHRSVPINIPPKIAKDDITIGKPGDEKVVHMPQQMLQSDSELSSVHSTYEPSEHLYTHQDSRLSQLQFSVSSASIAAAADADGSAKNFSSPRAHFGRPHGGSDKRRWADRADGDIYADWSAESNGVRGAGGTAPETISSWEQKGGIGSMDYLPSGSVQEAKRLLKHAALSTTRTAADGGTAARPPAATDMSAAASGMDPRPMGAIAAALAAPANAAQVASWLGADTIGPQAVHPEAADGDANTHSGAPAIAAALAQASFSRVGERGAELTLAGGISAQGNGTRSAFGGAPAPESELKASAQLSGTAAADREAIPIYGMPDDSRLDRVAESPDDVLGLSFSDHFNKVAETRAVSPAVPASDEEPATVASFAEVLRDRRELSPGMDLRTSAVEGLAPKAEAVDQGVGASLARLNREVEEAHMAREVTRIMTQDPPVDLSAHPGHGTVDGSFPPKNSMFKPLTPNRVSSPSLASANPAVTRLLRAEGSTQSMHSVQSTSATTPEKPSGMGMRAGSFPMALAALLRGRSSPNLLAAATGGSSSASPSYSRSGLRPGGASPAPLSPASSSVHLHRLSRTSRSPLQPGVGGPEAPPSVAPSSALSKAASSASLLASNVSIQGSRTPSLGSLADTASVPPSPRASLPLDLVVKKLPADLLDELAGGQEAEPEVKQMLANLLYSSPCSLCIVDATAPDQAILYVNAVFELQTGYSFEEVVGRNCRFLQAPPGEPHAPSFQSLALKRAINMGRSHTCKILNYAKDGTPLWNELSIVPVRTRAGDVSHYVGMQTFTHAHRPTGVSAFTVGAKSRQRSGSYAVLPSMAEEVAVGSVPRSSSHVLLTSMGGFSTPPAMVS